MKTKKADLWNCPECGKHSKFNHIDVFDTTGNDNKSDKSKHKGTLIECLSCGFVKFYADDETFKKAT